MLATRCGKGGIATGAAVPRPIALRSLRTIRVSYSALFCMGTYFASVPRRNGCCKLFYGGAARSGTFLLSPVNVLSSRILSKRIRTTVCEKASVFTGGRGCDAECFGSKSGVRMGLYRVSRMSCLF